MVQKEYRGVCDRIVICARESVEGVIPQGMPERSGMGAYLMARATADAAARKGQAHAVKLRIFVKRGQMQLWPVKIEQGEKFCPTRAARIAFQHPAFVALVCAQGPPDRKVFLKPPSQQGHIAFFAVAGHFESAKVICCFGAESPAHQTRCAVVKPLEQLGAGARQRIH